MITTRRQIMSEKDRYGGYNVEPATAKLVIDEPVINNEPEKAEENFSFSRAREIKQEVSHEVPVAYTQRRYPNTAEYIGVVSAPVRERRHIIRDSEAIMPSIKTRSMRSEKPIETPVKQEKSKASAKTKLILAAYAMVVVVLAAVVIGTGLAISGAASNVSSLESELNAKNAIILKQNDELKDLSDELVIADNALDQDMEKVGDTIKVDSSISYTPPIYESKSNWFDAFCDWLSRVIGG